MVLGYSPLGSRAQQPAATKKGDPFSLFCCCQSSEDTLQAAETAQPAAAVWCSEHHRMSLSLSFSLSFSPPFSLPFSRSPFLSPSFSLFLSVHHPPLSLSFPSLLYFYLAFHFSFSFPISLFLSLFRSLSSSLHSAAASKSCIHTTIHKHTHTLSLSLSLSLTHTHTHAYQPTHKQHFAIKHVKRATYRLKKRPIYSKKCPIYTPHCALAGNMPFTY